jgi:hypothetical protein
MLKQGLLGPSRGRKNGPDPSSRTPPPKGPLCARVSEDKAGGANALRLREEPPSTCFSEVAPPLPRWALVGVEARHAMGPAILIR